MATDECPCCGQYTEKDEMTECGSCGAKVCQSCIEETENGPTCSDCIDD